MAGLLQAIAWLLLLAATPLVLLAALVGCHHVLPDVTWGRRRPEPATRTLEEVSADVRRVSARFHQEGMRHAQYEGRRQAYDRLLAEAATMLEVDHLLDVLPNGSHLDDERRRVERVLSGFGVLTPV
ncbi:hypothetical protein GCM10009623_11030 [Nocardioides aestuarii]|uniref:DUF4129 domain-containing protein n=1 Tax=Nocardioides aestuarii TaxID=252231 RepID=A0ABW4TMD7_9ACTN